VGLKNSSKGKKSELKVSENIHANGIPLLISSQFLRSRGCGQVDLARFIYKKDKLVLEVIEVKSSQLGKQTSKTRQRRRLQYTCNLLGSLFHIPVKLRYMVQWEK
jgi:hypothetical protein